MSSNFNPRPPATSRVRFTVVLVGGAALALVWLWRSPSSVDPVSAVPAAPAKTSLVSASSAPLKSSDITEAAPPVAEEQELLRQLRGKLETSPDAVLGDLAGLARTRPTLAIDLAHALGRTPQEKSDWVKNLAQQWADQQPQAAWDWLRKLPAQRMQELGEGDLTPVVLGAMAMREPKMVVENLDTLLRAGNASESVSTPVALHVGLQALIEHGNVALAHGVVDGWAKDPARLNLEAAAYETVAMALVRQRPGETGEWLRSLPANDERNAAFAAFAATWAEKDPRAALQWAEALPANEGQQAALQRTVSDWIEQHPDQVSGWLGDYLARMPPGAGADTLIETVINNSPTLRRAPQSALHWTNLISDPAKRIDYHETIAVRWSEQDAAAALDFVAKSTVIPAGRKPAVLQKIQMAQPNARPGS